jgi:hypothetical protein
MIDYCLFRKSGYLIVLLLKYKAYVIEVNDWRLK